MREPRALPSVPVIAPRPTAGAAVKRHRVGGTSPRRIGASHSRSVDSCGSGDNQDRGGLHAGTGEAAGRSWIPQASLHEGGIVLAYVQFPNHLD